MEFAYQNSVIAQILEAIIDESTYDGATHSDIAEILLSILNKTEYNKPPRSVIADLFLRVKKKIEGEAFDPYEGDHISRIADILISILNETEYSDAPQSRIAELLLELKAELEAYTEVTVSGAIASFNTNVVKPLVNGEFAINAMQLGLGDPSPVNERPIFPFRNFYIVNVSGYAEWIQGVYSGIYGVVDLGSLDWTYVSTVTSPYFQVGGLAAKANANGVCYNYERGSITGDNYSDKVFAFTATGNLRLRDTRYTTTEDLETALQGVYLIYEFANPIIPYIQPAVIEALCASFHIEYKQYYADVGEEVYGAVYNSVTGGKKITSLSITLDGTQPIQAENWRPSQDSVGWLYPYSLTENKLAPDALTILPGLMCDKLKPSPYRDLFNQTVDNAVCVYTTNELGLLVRNSDTTLTTKEAINAYLEQNPITVVFPLATPIDKDPVSPTPINTFNGDNNIFTIVGDSNVTYLYKGTPPTRGAKALISDEPQAEKTIEDDTVKKDLEEIKEVDNERY